MKATDTLPRSSSTQDRVPSDFFHSNLYVTFMEDPFGLTFRSVIGVDNILWSSDYPHRESTWPRSRETLERIMAGIAEEERTKITYSNSARMFGFQ